MSAPVFRRSGLLPGALAVPLAAALALVLWAGSFTRYMADDFSYSAALRAHGLLADQLWWYVHWSGRFSSTLASSLAERAGPRALWPIQMAVLLLWAGALVWALCPLCRSRGLAVVAAHLLLVGTLAATPDLAQSVYWQMGLLSYAAPLALGTLCAGLVGRGRGPLACAVLTLGAGGFSETYALAQAITLAGALALCWRAAGPRRGAALGALGGAAGALLIVLAAPGNAVRASYLPPHLPLLPLLEGALAQTGAVLHALVLVCAVLAVCGVAAGRLVHTVPAPGAAWLGLLPAWVLLVTLAPVAAAWYAQAGPLPERALLIPTYLACCAALAWGLALGRVLRPQAHTRLLPPVLLACSVLVLALGLGLRAASWAQRAAPYAVAWEARDQRLRAHPGQVVAVVPLRSPAGLSDTEGGPAGWIIPDVAAYYGVRAIRLAPSARGAARP